MKLTTLQINLLTASHRADHPRAHTLFSLTQQRTIWTRSLERLEQAGLGFTAGAKDLRARLAAMEATS
jgi:hypothetical protein